MHAAKAAKNDEFYTQYEDIEKEMKHYKNFFKGKVVYCNCDDPLESNFTKYFILNFHYLGLKQLICTFYDIKGEKAYAFEYDGQDMNNDGIITEKDIEILRSYKAFQTPLCDDDGFSFDKADTCHNKGIYGSGDFRSKNCIYYLKKADVVVTNPPFSLFREYVAQLMEYNKKFLIIGNGNAITYKEIFPLIKENKMWLGTKNYGSKFHFVIPDGFEMKSSYYDENGVRYGAVNNAIWFTNIPNAKRNQPLDLYKKYSTEEYPTYDNYNAINCDKVSDIPMDYDGVIGVPISFLDKYCPEQFEILGCADADVVPQGWKGMTNDFVKLYYEQGNTGSYKEGNRLTCYIHKGKAKVPFKRILIRRKH